MAEIVRLFVGNVPRTAHEEDVRALVSKICPVNDVYIPPKTPTGLPRPFAIVEIKSDMKALRKCLQILNNTNWKGSRLRIEVARQFYADKLNQERSAENEPPKEDKLMSEHMNGDSDRDTDTKETPVNIPPALKIKKSLNETIVISTIPLDEPEKDIEPEPAFKYSSFNKRNVIKYKPKKVVRAVRLFFNDEGRPIPPIHSDVEGAALHPSLAPDLLSHEPAAPIITKPLGGGAKQRMGFGFKDHQKTKEDSMACVEDTVAQKWHSKTIGGLDLNDGRFQDRFKTGGAPSQEDYYEFAEQWPPPPERVEEDQVELVDSAPIVPSVAESEVTAEFLAAEKTRLLNTLQLLFKKSTDNSGSTDVEDKRPMRAARKAVPAGEGWGSAIVARYDPSAATAEAFHSEKINNALSNKNNLDFENNGPLSSFANLSVLKDIFHPDESSAARHSPEDTLFLETEKLALNTGASNDASVGMTFDFFGSSGEEKNQGIVQNIAFSRPIIDHDGDVPNSLMHAHITPHDDSIENVDPNLPTLDDVSFINIVEDAIKFRREKSEEEVHANWLEIRDKLGLAYKKKRREVD